MRLFKSKGKSQETVEQPKTINDYLAIKNKAISKKLENIKLLTEIFKHNEYAIQPDDEEEEYKESEYDYLLGLLNKGGLIFSDIKWADIYYTILQDEEEDINGHIFLKEGYTDSELDEFINILKSLSHKVQDEENEYGQIVFSDAYWMEREENSEWGTSRWMSYFPPEPPEYCKRNN